MKGAMGCHQQFSVAVSASRSTMKVRQRRKPMAMVLSQGEILTAWGGTIMAMDPGNGHLQSKINNSNRTIISKTISKIFFGRVE